MAISVSELMKRYRVRHIFIFVFQKFSISFISSMSASAAGANSSLQDNKQNPFINIAAVSLLTSVRMLGC